MGGARKVWITLLAAVCAAALAACGGDDDDSTTGAATGAEGGVAQSPAQPGGGSEQGDEPGSGSGEGGEGGGETGDSGGGGGSSGFESKTGPGPKKGERSYAFRTPGGDNSIQEFGEEGDGGERAAANAAVDALYRAMASGDYTEVCAKYLSTKNIEQIKFLAEKSPQVKGKSCAEVLGGLSQVSGGRSPDKPADGVESLRIEGDTAFAIWRGQDGNGYALPLISEGGAWKLTALAPTPLNPGA
jgi:hypothetical protein